MRAAVLLILLLASCTPARVPVPPPAETPEQRLIRTEGVSCADISAHAEGDAPDCQQLVAAFDRGRKRVLRLYPQAESVKMSAVAFYRPTRYWTGLPCQP